MCLHSTLKIALLLGRVTCESYEVSSICLTVLDEKHVSESGALRFLRAAATSANSSQSCWTRRATLGPESSSWPPSLGFPRYGFCSISDRRGSSPRQQQQCQEPLSVAGGEGRFQTGMGRSQFLGFSSCPEFRALWSETCTAKRQEPQKRAQQRRLS